MRCGICRITAAPSDRSGTPLSDPARPSAAAAKQRAASVAHGAAAMRPSASAGAQRRASETQAADQRTIRALRRTSAASAGSGTTPLSTPLSAPMARHVSGPAAPSLPRIEPGLLCISCCSHMTLKPRMRLLSALQDRRKYQRLVDSVLDRSIGPEASEKYILADSGGSADIQPPETDKLAPSRAEIAALAARLLQLQVQSRVARTEGFRARISELRTEVAQLKVKNEALNRQVDRKRQLLSKTVAISASECGAVLKQRRIAVEAQRTALEAQLLPSLRDRQAIVLQDLMRAFAVRRKRLRRSSGSDNPRAPRLFFAAGAVPDLARVAQHSVKHINAVVERVAFFIYFVSHYFRFRLPFGIQPPGNGQAAPLISRRYSLLLPVGEDGGWPAGLSRAEAAEWAAAVSRLLWDVAVLAREEFRAAPTTYAEVTDLDTLFVALLLGMAEEPAETAEAGAEAERGDSGRHRSGIGSGSKNRAEGDGTGSRKTGEKGVNSVILWHQPEMAVAELQRILETALVPRLARPVRDVRKRSAGPGAEKEKETETGVGEKWLLVP